MKIVFTILLNLSIISSYCQQKYHIDFESDLLNDGDILYLSLFDGHYDFRVGIDSVVYKSGAIFEGMIGYGQPAMISDNRHQVRVNFVLTTDTPVVIKMFESNIEINGGKENKIRNTYRTLKDSIENTRKYFRSKGSAHREETVLGRFYRDLYLEILNQHEPKYSEMLFSSIDDGFNSIAALEFVYSDRFMRTKEKNRELYNKLSSRMKADPVGIMMYEYIYADELTVFPKIEGQVDSTGAIFNYDFPTKGYTLVDFWASWCGPCIESFSTIQELYEDYHDSHNFEVIGISLDDSSTAWKNTLRRKDLSWINLAQKNKGFSVDKEKDLRGQENTLAIKTASNSTLPVYFLLDTNGEIVLRANLISEVKAKLLQLLNDN